MAMQYMGWVSVAGVKIPATSCSLDKTASPFTGDLIWGGGYHINYAKGKQAYAGDIAFPLFNAFLPTLKNIVSVGNGSNLRDAFFTTLVDDSVNLFSYTSNCKVGSMTLSSSGDGPLQCSLSIVSKGRTVGGHSAGSGFTASTVATSQTTPVPYFNSQFTAFGIPSDKVVSWQLSVTNNPFVLYTHDGTSDPNDIQLGVQVVTGTFSYYDTAASGFGFQTGSISSLETGAIPDTDDSCGSLSINGSTAFTFGLGVIKSAPRALSNPSEKPMRQVTFELLGTATLPPIR